MKYDIRRCSVCELKPGMKIGQTVYTDSGATWLADGTTLNEDLIRRLEILDIGTVLVRVDHAPAIPPEQAVAAETIEFVIPTTALNNKVNTEYDLVLASVTGIFSMLRLNRRPEQAALDQVIDTILEWTSRSAFLANYLLLAPPRPDFPVQHSVHVAAIGAIIGITHGLSADQLRDLVLCGLLHDIGFLFDEKDGQALAGDDNSKAHPVKGFKRLQVLRFLPESVLYGVLQHHERFDGSGYPLGVTGAKIHLFAKLIGVADAYELLTARRLSPEKPSPFQVMKTLQDEMIDKLDPVFCTAFLEYLTKSLLGNIVLLSDGSKAQIVYWHPAAALPLVRNENGQFIDLSKQRDVSITEIIGA